MAASKKRDDIIRATIELSAEKGINGATTVLIAERAHTAEVTIFRQFKTKEALLHTIFEEQMERIRAILLTGHDETLSIEVRFKDLSDKILQYFLGNPLELSFLEQYIHTPLGWERRPDMQYQTGGDYRDYPLIHLISEGIERKEIKSLSMPSLMGLVVGTLGTYARECHLKKQSYDKQAFNALIQACWDGVKA
jgi:AcrR family transcriptional regulator